MAPSFPFDNIALPHLRTRKALLILDLQNDFVSAGGLLSVTSPDGLVDRIIEVAGAFVKAGAGDVIWVRSQFHEHRSPGNEQIITSDAVLRPSASSRIRRRVSEPKEEASETDPEAFLSTGGSPASSEQDPRQCALAGTWGSELVTAAAAAVDSGRDLIFTKTHYSAFESSQLLMRLRTRFITELYICGALTNISIYATALDAGRHGLAVTIIEDCCGYRSERRHINALRKLVQLTGCETSSAEDVTTAIAPKDPPNEVPAGQASGKTNSKTGKNDGGKHLPIRPRVRPAGGATEVPAGAGSSGAAVTDSQSPATQPPQPPVASATTAHDNASSSASSPNASAERSESLLPSELTPPAGAEGSVDQEQGSGSSHIRPPIPSTGSVAAHPTVDKEQVGVNTAPSTDNIKTGDSREADEQRADHSESSPSDDPARMSEPGEETALPAKSSGPICEGDTTVIYDILPASVEDGVFERLRDEVQWLRMSHQGGEVPRLVCVQGEVDDDGNMPMYRHPADESPPLVPFTPSVVQIKSEVEQAIGHPLNHVLIQFYRDGNDYISEHSDKTLDIVPGSFICNVSLGAERTMIFRTKRADKDPSRKSSKPEDGSVPAPAADADDTKRKVCRVGLPHNSLCRMGLKTNMRWLHAIRQDRRADRDKLPAELAFNGGRISLTFRRIGTFLDRDSSIIWGQGATSKSLSDARSVVNGQTPEAVRMLQAFGTENHSSDFDWDKHYGEGFNVLHMSNAPRFFTSTDPAVNMRIQLMLAAHSIAYAKGSVSPALQGTVNEGDVDEAAPLPAPSSHAPVKFMDNDAERSTVHGDAAILLFLEAVYGGDSGSTTPRPALARRYTRFQQGLELLDKWRALRRTTTDKHLDRPNYLKSFKRDLGVWNGYASEPGGDQFIAGGEDASIADYAVWPVLGEIEGSCGGEEAFISGLKTLGLEALSRYYLSFKARDCVDRVRKERQENPPRGPG